jgi:hypothetical protein
MDEPFCENIEEGASEERLHCAYIAPWGVLVGMGSNAERVDMLVKGDDGLFTSLVPESDFQAKLPGVGGQDAFARGLALYVNSSDTETVTVKSSSYEVPPSPLVLVLSSCAELDVFAFVNIDHRLPEMQKDDKFALDQSHYSFVRSAQCLPAPTPRGTAPLAGPGAALTPAGAAPATGPAAAPKPAMQGATAGKTAFGPAAVPKAGAAAVVTPGLPGAAGLQSSPVKTASQQDETKPVASFFGGSGINTEESGKPTATATSKPFASAFGQGTAALPAKLDFGSMSSTQSFSMPKPSMTAPPTLTKPLTTAGAGGAKPFGGFNNPGGTLLGRGSAPAPTPTASFGGPAVSKTLSAAAASPEKPKFSLNPAASGSGIGVAAQSGLKTPLGLTTSPPKAPSLSPGRSGTTPPTTSSPFSAPSSLSPRNQTMPVIPTSGRIAGEPLAMVPAAGYSHDGVKGRGKLAPSPSATTQAPFILDKPSAARAEKPPAARSVPRSVTHTPTLQTQQSSGLTALEDQRVEAMSNAMRELQLDVGETLAECRKFTIDARLGRDIQACSEALLAVDDQLRTVRDNTDCLKGDLQECDRRISLHFEMYAQAHRMVSERERPDFGVLQRHRPLEIASQRKLDVSMRRKKGTEEGRLVDKATQVKNNGMS